MISWGRTWNCRCHRCLLLNLRQRQLWHFFWKLIFDRSSRTTGVGSAGRASSSGAPGLPGTVSPSVLLESLVVSSYNSCEESWRETISTSRSGCVVLFKISGYLILILFDFLTKRSVETIENPVLFISRFYLHRHRLLLSGQLIDHGLTGIHEFKFFLWWKKSITSAYESNLINQQ